MVSAIIINIHYIIVTILNWLFIIFIGLPLKTDIEGPGVNDTYMFIIGARPGAQSGYDLNIAGQIAGMVLLASIPPPDFAPCVLSCLESMSVNVTGTPIYDMGFNVSTRTLTLIGSAPDSVYEQVLKSIIYLNRARKPNIHNMSLYIDDGVTTSTHVFAVEIIEANMRRRRETTPPLVRRRLLSLSDNPEPISINNSSHSSYVSTGVVWVIAGIVIAVVVMAVLVIIRKRQASAVRVA